VQRRVDAAPDVEVLLRADGALFYEEVAPLMAQLSRVRREGDQAIRANLIAYLPEEAPGELTGGR
jgi:hypothetical protein